MSGTILVVIVLVVIWLVVLVPMYTQRRRTHDASRTIARFSSSMRVLARRSAPIVAGEADYEQPEPEADVVARPLSSMRAEMMSRRRRTLAALLALALMTAGLALLWRPYVWVPQFACDLLLVGYLGWLRAERKREIARRARRRARFARGERVARRVGRPAVLPAPGDWNADGDEDGLITVRTVSGAGRPVTASVTPIRPGRTEASVRPGGRETYGIVRIDDDDPELYEEDFPTAEFALPAVNG